MTNSIIWLLNGRLRRARVNRPNMAVDMPTAWIAEGELCWGAILDILFFFITLHNYEIDQ